MDVQWKVHEDLCGSDHHPITIFHDLVNTSYATPSWKLCKANCDHFAECASKHLGIDNPDISVEDFSKKLVDIATYTIPEANLQYEKETLSGSMTNVRRHVPIERKPSEKSSLTPQTTIFNTTKSSGPKAEL